MKAAPECIPCAIHFAIRTMRRAGGVREDVLREIIKKLCDFDLSHPPSYFADLVFDVIREHTGVRDPYKKDKHEQNRWALSVYPELKKMVDESDDRLLCAVKISALGNTIDLGVSGSYEVDLDLSKINLAINDIDIFREKLKTAKKILFIADNAGEIIFDRVLIEELGKPVVVGVKSGPIINDITIEEVDETGINAEFIETGTASLGVELEKVSKEFRKVFYESDVVISKGHANFETLDDADRDIFFLLRAKCEIVADVLGVKKGDIVFWYSGKK